MLGPTLHAMTFVDDDDVDEKVACLLGTVLILVLLVQFCTLHYGYYGRRGYPASGKEDIEVNDRLITSLD